MRNTDVFHDVLDVRTNPTWPTTWFAPILTGTGAFRSAYEVMNNWGANHCVMTCGHVGCCDDSPGRHASAHWEASGHPLIRSLEPGEAWGWCFEDERTL